LCEKDCEFGVRDANTHGNYIVQTMVVAGVER
jgi:hypothetical protein